MSSIYIKDGIYWYQRYVYNSKSGKMDGRVYHSMKTSDYNEAKLRQVIQDKKYNEIEESERLFPVRPLSICIDEYLNIKKKDISKQKRSINTYRADKITLTQFKNYITDNHGDIDIKKISKAHIIDFRNYRESLSSVKSKSTISLNLRVTRAFFSHCLDKEYIEVHPFQNIRIPKSEKRDQYPKKNEFEKLSKLFEVEAMRRRRKNTKSYGKHRKKEKLQWFQDNSWFSSLIWIVLNTGMRVGEVTILKWKQGKDDIGSGHSYSYSYLSDDFETITIHFKRSRREIQVTPQLKPLFKNISKTYTTVKNSKKHTKRKIYVFENEITGDVHHTTTAAKLWRKFTREMKLNENWTIHSLRHGFASYLLNQGASMFVVSELLGHSNIEMLDIYGHSTAKDMFDTLSLLPWKE